MEFTRGEYDAGFFVWLNGEEISGQIARMVASPFPHEEVYGVVEVFTEAPMGIGNTIEEAAFMAIANYERGYTTIGVTEWRGGLIRWDYR